MTDLLNFASDPNPALSSTQLDALLQEVVGSLEQQLSAQGIATVLDVPVNTTVLVDPEMTRSVLLNLVFNAMDAMPDGGEIVITAYNGPEGVELEIADSGPGLTDDVKSHLFEPFYTTKREGTGLGLAVVERIVRAHGAQISAINCPEGGAAFTVTFPRRFAMEAAA